MTPLLHCPFCGPGQSVVDLWFDDVAHRWRVGCGACGCSTGTHPTDRTEAPAIAAWNKRGDARNQPEGCPMTYLYHFHAMWQVQNGNVAHIDGTVVRDRPVATPEQYIDARNEIAARMQRDHGVPPEKMTLAGFTLLHTTND